MRFSVIIPVYNVEPYLRECLDSMLQQTCPDWEAVCVDDGSTDGSAGILAEYASRDSRFCIVTQSNGGLSAARNTGLDHAQGDYILFLDSDDWLENKALESINTQLSILNSQFQIDMLCFGGWRGEQEERPTPAAYPTGWDYYNHQALAHHDFPFVCVVLRCYRRQFLEQNGLRFREGILHEDNHFTPRVCLAAQRVAVIANPLYHYRIREGSIMTTRGLKNKESLITIGNELSELFANETGIDRTVVYRALSQYYQVAFTCNTKEEDRRLKQLIDWNCYYRVSRTKLRHYRNYLTIKISPILFRFINNMKI